MQNKGILPFLNQETDKLMGEFLKSSESFCNPAKESKSVDYIYSFCDRVSAERPDNNFAEAVITDAFEKFNKDPKFAEKDNFSEKDVYEDVG